MFECNKALVVAAHPDDEVLGCGGTIARLIEQKVDVEILFLTNGESARGSGISSERIQARRDAAIKACAELGVESTSFLDFPDNKLDSVPVLTLTQSIEDVLDSSRPECIFTHFAYDMNVDHRKTHEAINTACRPQPGCLQTQIYYFEVVSSTEWQPLVSSPVFSPTVFIDISSVIEKKFNALNAYAAEMRDWPHARSIRAIEHHMRWRGATMGLEAAEAFMLGRRLYN